MTARRVPFPAGTYNVAAVRRSSMWVRTAAHSHPPSKASVTTDQRCFAQQATHKPPSPSSTPVVHTIETSNDRDTVTLQVSSFDASFNSPPFFFFSCRARQHRKDGTTKVLLPQETSGLLPLQRIFCLARPVLEFLTVC